MLFYILKNFALIKTVYFQRPINYIEQTSSWVNQLVKKFPSFYET